MNRYYVLSRMVYRISAHDEVAKAFRHDPEHFSQSKYATEEYFLRELTKYLDEHPNSLEFNGNEKEYQKFLLGLEMLR